ncbi:DUF4339 domain-containing protein [Acinetobacter puyangensis]|uniref:DUF4339 domain-containing protein n=1 Tax=Acinetobacter puyangensis TaxID=1096779 RepID=UPI003A4D2231
MEQDFTLDKSSNEWFYEKNGERIGAISEAEMQELIQSGILSSDTVVWKKGLTNWKKLEQTELKQYIDDSVPPPLTGQHINNTVVWFLAFAPILGLMLEYFVAGVLSGGNVELAAYKVQEGYYFLITIALNIVLSIMDANRLEKAGISTEKFKGMVWLVPVYLFQRAKALNQNFAYFIVWIVCFILMLY